MKKLLFGIALALIIGSSCCYGQSKVIRRQKTKTEQTQSQTRKKKKSESKRRQNVTEDIYVLDSIGAEIIDVSDQSQQDVETFTVNGVTFEMVRVDGGSYQMGSYSGDSDEQPVHTETVGTFYIGKTEVTQRLWSAVMGSNPSNFRGENLPVEMVSWYDCQEFVDRLSRITGRIFRLPTEAEWEYAARGGNRSRGYTYSGSNDVYRVAWYTENSGSTTHPVAQKLDNELGIYDMSGNVWEWCSDNWCDNYSSPRNSSVRVDRGGSWSRSAACCRVAYRSRYSPGSRYDNLGLRLAL